MTVTVLLPSKEVIKSSTKVTLMCLVTSPGQLKGFNIMWSESRGQEKARIHKGVEWPVQMHGDGNMATSLYNASKENWDKDSTFECTFKSGANEVSSTVSIALGNAIELPTSCP